jgi:hypothetical protein
VPAFSAGKVVKVYWRYGKELGSEVFRRIEIVVFRVISRGKKLIRLFNPF